MEDKIMSLDRFSLDKVKVIKDGGLEVNWQYTETQGNLTYVDDESKTSSKVPHPDLTTKINTLKPFLAKIWGFDSPKVLADSGKFDKEVSERLLRLYNEHLSKIEITGIKITGKGEKIAVVITGKRNIYKNIFQPMNSGRLQLNQKIHGFENDIEDLVPEIQEEVFEYLFNGKCQSPELFGKNEQAGVGKEEKKDSEDNKETPVDKKSDKSKRKKGEPQPKEPNIV